MVCVDAPLAPERDLIAMLKQTKAIPHDINSLVLKSYWIVVEEEKQYLIDLNASALVNDHIRDLLQKYQNDEESKYLMNIRPCFACFEITKLFGF